MSGGGGGGNQIKETPLQKTQAAVASEQWKDYEKRWLPVQQFFIRRTEGSEPSTKGLLEGRANADIQGRYGNAETGLNASLGARGAVAGSGKSIFGNARLAGDKASSLGSTLNNVDDAVTRHYLGGLQDIVQLGRGQRATSDSALSDIAGLSGQQAAAQAQIAEQDAAGLGEAIGTGVGTAGGYGLSALLNRQPAATAAPEVLQT